MAKFYYNNIEAEKIILEFKCDNCCKRNVTAKLQVPEMYIDDTSSKNTLTYQHICDCGKEFVIRIHSGIYADYGEIDELDYSESDDFISVREIPSWPYGKETIFLDTIGAFRIINETIKEIEYYKIKEKTFLYNLLFSNMISLVDSFIKIYAEPIVLSDVTIKERFIKEFKQKKKDESDNDFVKRIFEEKSFQNPNQQIKLLYKVLCSDMKYEFPKELYSYVRIRNLLIHRNGIHKDGFTYNVTKEELLSASQILQNHFCAIYRMLFRVESEIATMRNLESRKGII